jgi:hypothetical protein
MYGILLCFQLEMSTEKFPISFDDIWEKAGYDHKWKAKSAFSRCVVNFGLQEAIDFATVRLESTGGRPGQTFKMTVRAAKRLKQPRHKSFP